jgi:hypothetical protein
MPRHSCPLNFDLSENENFQLLEQAKMPKKQLYEAHTVVSAIKAWKEDLEQEFGRFNGLEALSNPDDPPDFELHTERKTIWLEHTRLLREDFGKANAIKHKMLSDQVTVQLSLSDPPPKTTMEYVERMLVRSSKSNFKSTNGEIEAWLHLLLQIVEKKCSKNNTGILVIQNDEIGSFNNGFNYFTEILAERLQQALNEPWGEKYTGWVIILHSQLNGLECISAICINGSIKFKRL